MSRKPAKPQAGATQNSLLGDLESIRTLLDDDEAERPGTPVDVPGDDDVPMLEDVVRAAAPDEQAPRAAHESAPIFDDAVIESLLGDDWRTSANELIASARNAVDAARERWSPEETNELNEVLGQRIDDTVYTWVHETLKQHVGGLHNSLLLAIREELDRFTRRLADQEETDSRSTDGE